jgi:hypothetical protein
MKQNKLNALACLALCFALAACGGGGGGSSTPPVPNNGSSPPPSPTPTNGSSPPPSPTPTNGSSKVSGVVVASDTGLPLANVKVLLDNASVQTAADGTYTLQGLSAAPSKVIRFELAGYAINLAEVSLSENQVSLAHSRLTPLGATSTLAVATGGTVTVPNSPAAVALPAGGLVNASGAPVTGNVTVEITPINPANDPANMPGSLNTVQEGATMQIESFGALQVNLKDAQGNPLQLATGQKATVRIPASSRAAGRPDDVPLYYLDEATGKWVQEGSATLKSDATGQYYEGTVTHFSTWNADRIYETVFVQGCIVDAFGKPAPYGYVTTSGVNYSGNAAAYAALDGTFSAPVRHNSTVLISAQLPDNSYASTLVNVESSNLKLPDCLKPSAEKTAPIIISQPISTSVPAERLASFTVLASGPNLRFQWQRNGADIAGATLPILTFTAKAIDNGANYAVVISNANSTTRSAPAVLNVLPAGVPFVRAFSVWPSVPAGLGTALSVAPIGLFSTEIVTYQWRRNGVNIPGANNYIYFTPPLTTADNGVVYTVIASNSVGSASDSVTLVVEGEFNYNLLALSASALSFDTGNTDLLTDTLSEDATAGNVADLCASGTASATLNGTPLVAGQKLPASGTIKVTYTNCVDPQKIDGTTFNGSVSMAYSYDDTQPNNAEATYTLSEFRTSRAASQDGSTTALDITDNREFKLTFKASTSGSNTETNIVYSATPGGQRKNNLTGQVVVHQSGTYEARTRGDISAGIDQERIVSSRDTYKNLTFTYAGATYSINGSITTKYGASGSIIETFGENITQRNGAPLGRTYASISAPPLYRLTETFGEVPAPFSDFAKPETAKILQKNMHSNALKTYSWLKHPK